MSILLGMCDYEYVKVLNAFCNIPQHDHHRFLVPASSIQPFKCILQCLSEQLCIYILSVDALLFTVTKHRCFS